MRTLFLYRDLRGTNYVNFIDYALKNSDFFMLVYCNYGKKFSRKISEFSKNLDHLKVKTRTNSVWPGTESLNESKFTYRIRFYRSDDSAKELLYLPNGMFRWMYPDFPEDLCFFKGNKCWITTIAHEEMMFVDSYTKEDYTLLNRMGICDEDALCNEDRGYIEEGLM